MRTFLALILILICFELRSEVIKDKIFRIDQGMLKFQNGRVAYLNSFTPNLDENDFVKVEIDQDSNILSVKKLYENSHKVRLVEDSELVEEFEPTIVANKEEAFNIFNRSNPNYKRVSECSDRAHVWAHDEFKFSKTKSEKIFIFFTASYINSVRFKWWFHVAPMYSVKVGNAIEKLVMDYRFTDRPMTIKEFSDQFVYTKRHCKVTTKFSEYDVNPQTENCYLMFSSMHYKIPTELSRLEREGIPKTETSEFELKSSLNLAFQNI